MKDEKTIKRDVFTPGGLHVREKEDGTASRTIEGYAIVFNTRSAPMWDYDDERGVEIIAPEAVTRELLDGCDIKMTMFHDRQLILARSNKGQGTLDYEVDGHGVKFRFDAPATVDGDKALELVKRGDIAGCSFMFRCRYCPPDVTSEVNRDGDTVETVYTVRTITGVQDFTLTPDPAYPATDVNLREAVRAANAQTDNSRQLEEMYNQIKNYD